MRSRALLGLALLAACGRFEANKGPYDTDPVAPAAALDTFELADGFRAELFAAEPDVVDPVEMCFDENGGVYVAEMLDYPFDPQSGEKPRSRIRYLEDTDNDGKVDHAVIFADELLQVTSVFPWEGGIFVASAPDILYLKDTDGDHVSDFEEVWYSGFDTNVSPEARITNFRLAYDNWVYAANNGRAGKITSPKFPERPAVYVRGYDFRFSPTTGEFAQAAGPTQFGMSFNEWGDRFVTQNTVHLRHAVLPARYILRNPFYTPDSMLYYVPGDDSGNSRVFPLTSPQQWRIERTEIRQERYDKTRPGRVELVGGHFTAATGTTVYLGDTWGDDYYGNVFVDDANGGLVHRELLHHDGPTYRSEPQPPLDQQREFLRSTDAWFRPVNMANAPDGNLYVMDFYREYIEEPASIPEAIKQRLQLDFYRGDDRGRIWRIRRDDTSPQRGLGVALGRASTSELVNLLTHANGWHRQTAQRLLLERQDAAATESLRALSLSALVKQGGRPEARVHALWLLEDANSLDAAELRSALDDDSPIVRRQAVRLAEAFPQLHSAIAAKKTDTDAKVRLQVALSAGELRADSERLIAEMAATEADDAWFRAALLSSAGQLPWEVLNRLLIAHPNFFSLDQDHQGHQAFVEELAAMIGAQAEPVSLTKLLAALRSRPAPWTTAALTGVARGLSFSQERQREIRGAEAAFTRWLASNDDALQAAAIEAAQYFWLPEVQRHAQRNAAASDVEIGRRIDAVKLLRGGSYGECSPPLQQILLSPAAPELHIAAIETLSAFDDPEAARLIVSGWRGYGPQARERAADAMIRRRGWVDRLLDAVEKGDVAAASVDAVAKIRLAEHPDPKIQARAETLLGKLSRDRAAVVAQFSDALAIEGSAERGSPVFKEHCAKCHERQGERSRLGPDLSGVNNKSREELLSHILDPSFEIQSNYTNYVIIERDGRIHDGLLAGETADAVTLRGEYKDVTIGRDKIAEMRASSVSLMPDGLEDGMTRQDLADVIAYLRAGL